MSVGYPGGMLRYSLGSRRAICLQVSPERQAEGQAEGKACRVPPFRSKRKARPSIRFTTGALRCEARHAVLPRIGRVKLHEPGTLLADLVAAEMARVMAVSVRFERGGWFAAFTVDTDTARPAPLDPDAVVGVDLGIKNLAVLSTGEQIPHPRHLTKALRKVRRLSRRCSRRRGPDRRTRQEPSNRWRRATAAAAKAQGRVADQRRDAIHQANTGANTPVFAPVSPHSGPEESLFQYAELPGRGSVRRPSGRW